jgi:hypothetical protein
MSTQNTQNENPRAALPWRIVPTTAKGAGTARVDIVTDNAEFSPAYVAGDIMPADAAFICRAVNAHDALVDALENCVAMLNMPDIRFKICDGGMGNMGEQAWFMREMTLARAALAKAKGGTP